MLIDQLIISGSISFDTTISGSCLEDICEEK